MQGFAEPNREWGAVCEHCLYEARVLATNQQQAIKEAEKAHEKARGKKNCPRGALFLAAFVIQHSHTKAVA
jgi:hypothetical protein